MNCCCCGVWSYRLKFCSICKRAYNRSCHIPPLLNTKTSKNLKSVDMEPWICTMCIDVDHISRVMCEKTSEPPKKSTLDENEMIMASRILLELFVDRENSYPFKEFPPKCLNTKYHEEVVLPVSLDFVKKRLSSKNSYYSSFTDAIVDIKRIYSNAIFFFSDDNLYNILAHNQQKLLFELLAKWVPQYHADPNN